MSENTECRVTPNAGPRQDIEGYKRHQGPKKLWTDLLNHAREWEKGGGFVTPL